MKKLLKISALALTLIALVTAPFALGAKTSASAMRTAQPPVPETQVFSASEMQDALAEFVGGESGEERIDRTLFGDGEKAAAKYLHDYMQSLGGFETSTVTFEYTPPVQNTRFASNKEEPKPLVSQNVTAVRKSAVEGAKSVIIGADYDNQYADVKSGNTAVLEGTKSAGAYRNGTGVATLMTLAKYIADNDVQLPFDLHIVFFGSGELWNMGADRYVKAMSAAFMEKTLLMVNLQHIGGDNTYIYCDEVVTKPETYLLSKAAHVGAELKTVPVTLPKMSAAYLDGMAYVHYGMLGSTKSFADRGIPYANIFGGTFDTLSLGLDEMKGQSNVSYTENDNVAYLNEHMTGYAQKMADTANMLISALTDENFIASVENAREDAFDYSLLMKQWIPLLIAISVLLACGLVLIPVARHFEKKYPYKPTARRVKVAVFGMDYEDPKEGDVFIDVKRREANNNPFKGY